MNCSANSIIGPDRSAGGSRSSELLARRGPILRGIVIALTGAASVIGFILSLTRLYVGAWVRRRSFMCAAISLFVIFWPAFNAFIRELLTAEERDAMLAAVQDGSAVPTPFGLMEVAAFVAFAVGLVLLVNGIRIGASPRGLSVSQAGVVAVFAGWRWHRKDRAQRLRILTSSKSISDTVTQGEKSSG